VDLLASVIPGFRTLRTPVAAGVLWMVDIVILLISQHTHIHVQHSTIVTANSLLPDWVGVVILPFILAAAYLLGSIMMSLTGPILRKAIDAYRSTLTHIASPSRNNEGSRLRVAGAYPWRKRIDLLARRSYSISTNAHTLLYDYVMTALTSAGATGTAAMMFPVDHIHEKLINCAPQLSQKNSTPYQEYDRIQAEAEFRLAVIPPLLATACLVPISYRWLLILGISIASLVLLVQSVSLTRTSNDILASAARVGYLEIPEIKSLCTALTEIDPKPISDGGWIAAIIVSLNRRGFFDETYALIEEATELDQEYDATCVVESLDVWDPDLADQFKRDFARNRGIEVDAFHGTGAIVQPPSAEEASPI
jgi:hypothetical protein